MFRKGEVFISDNLYKGKTPPEDYEQLISFLDEVFFTDDEEPKRDFLTLLPKLYKKENDPCAANHIVKEGDKIRAAVGLFYYPVIAGGERLLCGGIGNVAVGRESRSKGFMKETMNMAMQDMLKTGADYSMLGGQRQRYGYFSFEPAGVKYVFNVSVTNLRHYFGIDAENELEVKPLEPGDIEHLKQIDALLRSQPHYADTPVDKLFDVLCSWHSKPYIALKDGEFKGFFTVGRGGGLSDFKAASKDDLKQLVLAIFETVQDNSVGFDVAPFDNDSLEFFTVLAENCHVRHAECCSILRFENTARAFLKVKAAKEPLCDGSLVMLIHGFGGDEHFEIRVRGGEVTVEKTHKTPDVELGHHEAVRFLYSLYSKERRELGSAAKQWFPLPLYCSHFDAV